MLFIKKHRVLFFFLIGILLRLLLLFVDYAFDVNNHIVWAKDLHARGFTNFFNIPSSEVYGTTYPNYPPFALAIFYLIYPLQDALFKLVWWLNTTITIFPSNIVLFVQQKSFLAAIFKLPAIASDIALAYLVLKMGYKIYPSRKNLSYIAPALVLFNPVFFYNSAFWGQIDVIPLFALLLSYYVLVFSKKPYLSSALYTLSLLIKPTTLIFLPIYVNVFYKKNGVAKTMRATLLCIALFHLSFLPFLAKATDLFAPYTIYAHKILDAQSLLYTTNGAFNFWVLITQFIGIRDTQTFLLGLSYRAWGYFITFSFTVYLFAQLRTLRSSIYTLLYGSFFIALTSFLFLTKMHERYFMLPLPFLLLLAINNKQILRLYIAISVLAFLNLYHSWAVPHISYLFNIIDHPIGYITLSIMNICIFIFVIIKRVLLTDRVNVRGAKKVNLRSK